jgi:LmbE family N-acetylglucosaminyl deacetylase
VEHAPSGPVVVLSPHLDDAVLSTWSVISDTRDVAIVNVFAGVPESPAPPRWDRLAGASDSRAHMRARLEEDRAALALAGRSATNLPFLDRHYRAGDPAADELTGAIGEAVPAASRLFAPAGIGGHRDHELVRDVALELCRSARLPISLYAELPYAARFGWPDWVTGAEPADPGVVIDVDWEPALASAAVPRSALSPHVHGLDEAQAAAKLAAMRSYRTQFWLLNQGPIGLLEHPQVLPWELAWSVG